MLRVYFVALFAKIFPNLKREHRLDCVPCEINEVRHLSATEYLAVSGGPEVENSPEG
jgi:hypothetical protein